MFQTLHDYTFFVKSSGYLTAAVVLVLVMTFWLYLTGAEKKRKK
jgi:hypothetical protein